METTDLDVNVKTLDSQTHPFSVKSTLTVKEFKAIIEPTVNVAADQQRLIYLGKVLADDKSLKDYDIHGKTIHLVIRPPPSASHPQDSSTTGASSNSGRRSAPPGGTTPNGSQFVGAFYMPQNQFEGMNFGQIVQDVISNLGDLGRNATVTSATSDDGSAVDVHINLGQVSSQTATNQEVQQRVSQIRSLLSTVNRDLEDLEQNRPPSSNATLVPPREAASQGSVPMIGVNPQPSAAFSAAEAAFTAAEGAAAAASAAEAAAALARQAAAAVAASMYGGSRQSVTPSIVIRARSPNATSNSPVVGSISSVPTDRIPSSGVPSANPTAPLLPSVRTIPLSASARVATPFTSVEFADLLHSIRDLETRYRQHMENLEDSLRVSAVVDSQESSNAEQARRHRVLSNVMHQFGHIYYFLSDLFVNFNQPPPRNVGLFGSPFQGFSQTVPTSRVAARPPRSSSLPRTRSQTAAAASESATTGTTSNARRTQVTVAQAPVLVMEVGTSVRIPGFTASQPRTLRTQTAQAGGQSTVESTTTHPQTRPIVTPSPRIPVRVPVAIPVAVDVQMSSSRSWESVVPPSWVPVISRDLVRQREQLPPGQQPQQFSEAYLNGMPNKKRRTDGEDDSAGGSGGGGSSA